MISSSVKIRFPFYHKNGEEWFESLWAKPAGSFFELDNIPFYVNNYSLGDIVSVREINNVYFVDELIEESGNSTLHIVFFDLKFIQKFREEFRKLGCDSELSDRPNLIALNIPKEIDYYKKVLPKVQHYFDIGILDFSESCIAHNPDS